MRRRTFLASLGLTSLSGCLRLQGGSTPTGTAGTQPANTPTAAPTTTGNALGETATTRQADSTATSTEEPTDTPTETAPEEPTETETSTGDLSVSGAWSQFAGNAANTGFAPNETGPTDEVTERWRFDTGNLALSSPVIDDGRVVFTGFKKPGHIWAVDTETGEELWRQELAGIDHIGAAAIDGDRVYIPTWNRGGDRNRLFALNANAGSFVWQYPLRSGAFGSPTVSGDTVFIGDHPADGEANGDVVAVATSDGSERWRHEVTGVPLGTVAVVDGRVVATSLTPSNFETEYPSDWSDDADEFTPDLFFVFGKLDQEPQATVAEMAATGHVTALAEDGSSELWSAELPDFVVSGAAVADGTAVVGCWDHQIYGFDVTTGEQQWTHETDGPVSGQPSIADGTVFVGSWDGSLYAVSLADGRRQWIYPFGSKLTSSPAITEDRVYVSVDNRGVFGLTRQGRLDFEFKGPIGDYNASSPAIADGALVVCGDIAPREEGGERGGPFLLT